MSRTASADAKLNGEGAFIILNALEQLREVALAKAPAPASLHKNLLPSVICHVIAASVLEGPHASQPLNDLKEHCRPVAERLCEDLEQDALHQRGMRKTNAHQCACAIPLMHSPVTSSEEAATAK